MGASQSRQERRSSAVAPAGRNADGSRKVRRSGGGASPLRLPSQVSPGSGGDGSGASDAREAKLETVQNALEMACSFNAPDAPGAPVVEPPTTIALKRRSEEEERANIDWSVPAAQMRQPRTPDVYARPDLSPLIGAMTSARGASISSVSTASTIRRASAERWQMYRLWNWRAQAAMVEACQRAPPVFFGPCLFIHYFFKRDWGIALAPTMAFGLGGGVLAQDLGLAAMGGGVLCGIVKHIVRAPRPFWVAKGVFLKQGVEEMTWACPSAHSAIASSVAAALLWHSSPAGRRHVLGEESSSLTVAILLNSFLVLFTMFSRLYLGVHWPQDVLGGTVLGAVSGIAVCTSGLHQALADETRRDRVSGSLCYLSVGLGYILIVYICVKMLDVISSRQKVDSGATSYYQANSARALHLLDHRPEMLRGIIPNDEQKCKRVCKSSCKLASGLQGLQGHIGYLLTPEERQQVTSPPSPRLPPPPTPP